MKTKLYTTLITVLVITITSHVHAQNTFPSSGKVGIGTRTPNASSLLEVKSTTKGILIPRMTQSQRNAITSPATGLEVYVTDTNPGFYFYSGSSWVGLVAKNKGWLLTGNSSLDSASNFIGTTDNGPFSIRTKNVERVHVSSAGNVGIGTHKPYGKFNVTGGSPLNLTSPGFLVVGDSSSYNLGIDYDEIQARDNGSYDNLYLNYYGGYTVAGNTSNCYYGLIGYGSNYGLYGYSASGTGVYGSGSSYGIYGSTSSGSGVYGTASGGYGGYFYNSNGYGVEGYDAGSGGRGVEGYETGNGEGVYGIGIGTYGIGVQAVSSNEYGLYAITYNSDSYAGYFEGNLYTTGTYTGSDEKLKQNITDMSSAMTIISQLKPKNYNFRQDGNYKLMNLPQGQHYGLIAQDVEKILPGLVKETRFDAGRAVHSPEQPLDSAHNAKNVKPAVAKTGEIIDFNALNYTELIPIIIKGMQEMNAAKDSAINDLQNKYNAQQKEIEELKAMIVSANTNPSTLVSSASLQQNIPNPFSSATTIGYNLPSNYSSANIIVTDAKGVVLKQININSKGKGNVQLDASTLASGAYRYSLYVDGKIVDSKQMISSK